MAMASSGTDPLARLQTGSKELRLERELCQVAAEKGFSTESGADTSTKRRGTEGGERGARRAKRSRGR